MQSQTGRTRRERLDVRLTERERAALESLAAARRTTLTGALVELVLAAAPRERDALQTLQSEQASQAAGTTAGAAV